MIKPKSGKDDYAIWSQMGVSHPPRMDIEHGQAKKIFYGIVIDLHFQ